MIDYHYPIYKFKLRSIFPNLVTHFPTVDKQKKSRAKARGYIEKISPQKKKKKKRKRKECFGIVDLFLSMENGDGNSTWDCCEY